MVLWSGGIVFAGGAASYAAARRLTGETRIFGDYSAGFAAGAVIALVFVSTGDVQNDAQRRATFTLMRELASFSPAFGIGLAEAMRLRSRRLGAKAGSEAAPEAPARYAERLDS